MGSASAERGQRPTERGAPAALLECLAAMRMGAEAAFELEFASDVQSGQGAAEKEIE